MSESVNLWRVPVYGFEPRKDPKTIWCLYKAIERGDILPPVYVHSLPEGGGFYLSSLVRDARNDFYSDGGHHRAIAHMIAERELEVVILPFEARRMHPGLLLMTEVEMVEGRVPFEVRAKREPEFYDPKIAETYDVEFIREQQIRAHIVLAVDCL